MILKSLSPFSRDHVHRSQMRANRCSSGMATIEMTSKHVARPFSAAFVYQGSRTNRAENRSATRRQESAKLTRLLDISLLSFDRDRSLQRVRSVAFRRQLSNTIGRPSAFPSRISIMSGADVGSTNARTSSATVWP